MCYFSMKCNDLSGIGKNCIFCQKSKTKLSNFQGYIFWPRRLYHLLYQGSQTQIHLWAALAGKNVTDQIKNCDFGRIYRGKP